MTICAISNRDPGIINSTASASGGTGSYSYKWQRFDDSGSGGGGRLSEPDPYDENPVDPSEGSTPDPTTVNWVDIIGTSSATYDPPLVTEYTMYRRKVTSGSFIAYSNVISYDLAPELSPGTISYPGDTIYAGTQPSQITGSVATGGDFSYTYLWQIKQGESFVDIGETNNRHYQPQTLYTTTTYRRQVSSCGLVLHSNEITIPVLVLEAPASGTNGSRVGPGSVTLSVNAVTGATGYKWYTVPSGGTAIATTTTGTYETASLDFTTPFYVSATNGTTESATRYAMQATIQPQVSFPGASALAMGQSVTIEAPVGYDTYAWKDAQENSIGTTQTVEISTAGTYTLEVTKNGIMTASEPIVVTSAISAQNQNFIAANVIRVPGLTNIATTENLDVHQNAQIVQYFDGFARPVQIVRTKESAMLQDVVVPMEYDQFGRQAKEYLPFSYNSSLPGNYVQDALNVQPSFSEFNNEIAYAEKRFEASPLSRVVEQAAPGSAWQLSSGKTIKYEYLNNTTSDEVRLWTIQNDQPTSQGFYSNGQLYKNVTTDEDGNQSIEFVDKQKRTVLKRVQVDASTWADTYQIYDRLGNLKFVWQPQGVEELKAASWSVTPELMNNWLFQYNYDHRNRLIEKKIPGADWVYMVYDQWDRLVLTQDGNQRGHDEWLFTKYDAFNRPVLTGLFSTDQSVEVVRQNALNSQYRYVTLSPVSYDYYGYEDQTYPPIAEQNIYTITYYDSYAYETTSPLWTINDNPGHNFQADVDNKLTATYSDHTYSYPQAWYPITKGLVTGTMTRELTSQQWICTMSFYDSQRRLIQNVSNNLMGGLDRSMILYDFTGVILKTLDIHHPDVTDVASFEVLRRFEYDHSARLLATYHQLDDQDEVLLSSLSYNEQSRVIEKNLHAHDPELYQSLDFTYNIRGWLLAINDSELSDGEGDYFGMELTYNTNSLDGNKTYFNGNISSWKWSDFNASNTRAYTYDYDQLNRLKAANPFKAGASSTEYKVEQMNYDLNGNISALKRHGESDLIDDLSYDYSTFGNQLISVTDANTTDELTFVDRNTSGADYGYDANGNMVFDKNKGITSVQYNHLNLPKRVEFDANNYLVYYYDAFGVKLRQEVTEDGQLTMKRDYVGDFYYENDVLKAIQHEEGRVVVDAEDSAIDYQYYLKDHLGNTRLTFSTTPESYTITATMEDEHATEEEAIFENVSQTRVSMLAANQTTDGNKAARIPNTDPIGPMAMLEVNKGDKVNLETWAYYEGDGSTDGLISEAAILTALINAYGASTGTAEVSAGTQSALADGLDFPGNLLPKMNETNDDAPKAYLNYMLFDSDMTFITSGFKQISTAAQFNKELVAMEEILIDQNGYLMAYVSNESNVLNYVHFDDFSITHTKTPIVQVDDYYPFGLTYNSFTRNYSDKVRYKFQEQETDEETGWIAFKWRNHDPTIGRFFNIDPIAEKYLYNSTYAFSENRVVDGIELEGLEWVDFRIENRHSVEKVDRNMQKVFMSPRIEYYLGTLDLKLGKIYNTEGYDGKDSGYLFSSASVPEGSVEKNFNTTILSGNIENYGNGIGYEIAVTPTFDFTNANGDWFGTLSVSSVVTGAQSCLLSPSRSSPSEVISTPDVVTVTIGSSVVLNFSGETTSAKADCMNLFFRLAKGQMKLGIISEKEYNRARFGSINVNNNASIEFDEDSGRISIRNPYDDYDQD